MADDRYIIRTAELETHVPLAELCRDTGMNMSEQTIRQRLKESSIRKWKALNQSLLTKKHVASHLKWAKAHQNWTAEDWQRVAWSDECAVQKDSDPQKVWVFCHQTKHEKYAFKNI
jgi:broad specificity phosphatase PhoE